MTFDAGAGGTLSVGNGTHLKVPANAFVDAAGAPVTGDVTLSYTEMQDVASILISGIPLNLGEGKDMQVMESAVMFDLSAAQGDEELQLGAGKSIETVISSNQGDPAYNLYRLDEGKRSWDYLDNIAPEENPDLLQANQNMEDASASAEALDVSKCVVFNYLEFIDVEKVPRDKLFNYYTYDDYPNINTMKRLISTKINGYGARFVDGYNWEFIKIGGKTYPIPMVLWELEKPLPEGAFKVRNTSMISKRLKGDRYLFQLRNYVIPKRKPGKPYKSGKWVVLYSFIAKPRMPLAELYANPIREWSVAYDSLLQEVEDQKAIAAIQNQVVRSFAINELGIYNYDVIKDEERIFVNAEPVMNGESIKDGTDFYAIMKGRNAVVRYSSYSLNKFVLYPGQSMYLFRLTEGNKILQMKGDPISGLDLKALAAEESPELTIEFEESDFVVESAGDVSKFIDQVTGKAQAVTAMLEE